MIYKEKHPHYISAFQFESTEKVPEYWKSQIYSANNPYVVDKSVIDQYCPKCGKKIKEHGLIEGHFICPGSYIIYEGNKIVNLVNKQAFEDTYTEIGEVVAEI